MTITPAQRRRGAADYPKRAVLGTTIVLAIVGLLSSLRIVAIEATVPKSLRFDDLRPFNSQASDAGSLISPGALKPWIGDKALVHSAHARCAAARRQAISRRDVFALSTAKHECVRILREALLVSPTDGRLWLETAKETAALAGVTNEVLDALRMSYATAPREGWITGPRHRFAMEIWPNLPSQVKQLAIEENLDSDEQLALANLILSDSSSLDLPHGLALLEASAQSGNAYALERLGEIYLGGKGVHADLEKGRSYLAQAVERGSIGAQIKLGERLIRGDGMAPDPSTGLKLLEAAASRDQWGQLALASMLLSGELPRDVPRSLALLEASAGSGNIHALEKLGEIYLTGKEVTADPEKARAYLERAMGRGNIQAQIELGAALLKGDGLSKDTALGSKLLESAVPNDQWGQWTVGNMLLSGELPRDVPRGLALLEASAESGNAYALEKLGEIYLSGTLVAADSEKGQTYLERAIKRGSVGAQVKLGEALVKGQRLPRDPVRGVELLEAAARTDEWGQLTLGSMLLSGELPRDVQRGLALLERSAESGNAYALEKLGEVFLKGNGVAADPEKGRAYLERAAMAKR